VWHILADGDFELVSAARVKNVPSRKTDVDWLSDLLAHGLIRASFVPGRQTQKMRSSLPTGKPMVREKSSHDLWIRKTLEHANIKWDSVNHGRDGYERSAMIEALMTIPPSWPA
jgi:transposase